MMKNNKLVLFLLFSVVSSVCYSQNVIEKMFAVNAKDFRKSLSFIQQTSFFRNDSLIRKATWFEVISYPDKLRIDINDPAKGNALYFVNDSLYNFQAGQLRSRTYQPHDLLFVLGGMYSFTLEDAMIRLQKIGYNINKSYETVFRGRPVIVLGTDKDEMESDQLWVDKERLVALRIIENKPGFKSEYVCGDYIKLNNHWCETMVEIYVNGKLRQTEQYTQLNENININMDYFKPAEIGKVIFWK